MPEPALLEVLACGPQQGVVRSYDQERGLGSVAAAEGPTLRFHSTAITDGSRSIEAGTRVMFVARPGHGGALEAGCVTKLAEPEVERGGST